MNYDTWSYGDHDGPSKWAERFPVANGPRQSPIDIIPSQVQFDPSLKPIELKYDPSTCMGILNNGNYFQVDFADDDDRSTMTGGPLTGTFRLKQFHFHWGGADERGSEHSVGGTKYPCELHLGHWNNKYPNPGEAFSQPDGLAVIAVFLKIGAANPSLQKVLDALDAVKSKGKQTSLPNFDPKTLLPPTLDFWTYEGSLTTPPLLESATWIVLRDPISVSSAQMAKFRSMLSSSEGDTPLRRMVDNFRPAQPLNGRKVRSSFK
ncbi:hypothetical protein NFI96_018767 [Prochilodus magdalenae]|nr:hypothetical protein NFI96_018767 [Prochilodus magdalenae]